MLIFMAGGVSGGHLYPGIALAEALTRIAPGCRVEFLGTREGLDEKLVPAAGYPLHILSAGRGSPLDWRRPANAWRLWRAARECRRLFREARPDAVFALGGMAAAAPGWVAHRMRVPLFAMEPNAVPGRVNRLLFRWADTVHWLFPEARDAYAKRLRAECRVDGVPLRPALRALAEGPPVHGDALLVVGGSQGARGLNACVVGAAARFARATGARIIHVAGDAHVEAVRADYATRAPDARVEILGYVDDMATAMRDARLLVSRAGAGTITDAAAAGLPAVLVPLPTSRDDHQRHNAAQAARAGGAVVWEENVAAADSLADALAALWHDAPRRAEMAADARRFAPADAADRIARHILARIQGNCAPPES